MKLASQFLILGNALNMDDMQEMVAEFIVDCSENLEEFENNLLDLERDPGASGVLDSMFRQIHSIKGASGFMAFGNLESLTHKAENVLDLLRQDKGTIDQSLISTFLDVCDAMRTMFDVIQEQGNDGENAYQDLVSKLLNYEDSFKNGVAFADAGPVSQASSSEASSEPASTPQADATETLGSDEGEQELDALQIEALKSLGMYDESEASAQAESAAQDDGDKLELDPVQIESLKALGLYDENEVKASTVEQVEPQLEAKKEEPKQGQKKEAKKPSAPVQKKETIRVDVDTLDKLVNLAGELVLVRNQLLELAKSNDSQIFDQSFTNLDMVTGEIQRSLMTTRMQPISTVWNKMPRIVRDLAAQLGKDIQLTMQGENTELDKTIIEAIADPMTHIIRNCVDHGIEMPDDRAAAGKNRRGTVKLIAEHRGNWIHVDVIDDGKGIPKEVLRRKALEKGLYTQEELDAMDDQQTLNIIFHAGFSTKDQASNISGRGVGMDVIRSNISKINGNVELNSIEGKGTHLKIRLPLTLAIIPAVIVSINNERYAIPQNTVQEVAAASREDIEQLDNIGGQKFTRLRGQILPLVFASEFLGENPVDSSAETAESLNFVVINADGYTYGLVIDKVMDIIEIVVKPLDSSDDFKYYAGATIMGDGRVALILDANKIAEYSNIDQTNSEEELREVINSSRSTSDLTLLFKLRDGKNYLIPLSKTSRIEEISKSDIDHRQVGTFAKFNGRIIRIIDLVSLLDVQKDPEYDWLDDEDSLKCLYFEFNGHGIAIDVGFNHLLLQEHYDIEQTHNSEFVIGTSLIGDEVFEVLNLEDYLGKVIGDMTSGEFVESQDSDLEEQDANILGFDQTNSVISFQLGDLQFGIDLDAVSEIISTEEVTSTPGSRDSIDGLLNLRGEIMVSRSLNEILNVSLDDLSLINLENEASVESKTDSSNDEADSENNRRSLILHDEDHKMCLQVGKVDEILNINKDNYNTAPTNIPANILGYLKGVYKLSGSMLLLLDEKKMISEVVVEAQ